VARVWKRVRGLAWGADDNEWIALVDGYRRAELTGTLRVGARESDGAIRTSRGQEQHHGQRERERNPDTCLLSFCLDEIQGAFRLWNVMDAKTHRMMQASLCKIVN
jgi:hypothetical protein